MNGAMLFIGLSLTILGLVSIVKPYRVARLQERVDSIGSTQSWSRVEPADWRINVTARVGVFNLIIGVILSYASFAY